MHLLTWISSMQNNSGPQDIGKFLFRKKLLGGGGIAKKELQPKIKGPSYLKKKKKKK